LRSSLRFLTAKLVASADRARDARRWRAAASRYRLSLAVLASNGPIWVQLGNMLKECGQYAAAEKAYQQAIYYHVRDSDVHMQIGHVRKLAGKAAAAMEAYFEAFIIDPMHEKAFDEFYALLVSNDDVRTWRYSDHYYKRLSELSNEANAIREKIESRLEAIREAGAVPLEHFREFRELYPVKPPSGPATRTASWLVITPGASTGDINRTAASLATQVSGDHVTVVGAVSELTTIPRGADIQSILIAPSGTVFDPSALAWFDLALHGLGADAVYPDVEVESAVGQASRPEFQWSFDAITLEMSPTLVPEVMAFRGDELPAVLKAFEESESESVIRKYFLARHADRKIAHLPQILAAHRERLAHDSEKAASIGDGVSRNQQVISVIIPTRDLLDDLRTCVDALISRAASADRVEIIIVDNGSIQKDTLEYLEGGRIEKKFQVIRNDLPFNWALLNNEGARAAKGAILVFLNNDVRILAHGWDTLLEKDLAESSIGAVGGLLLYPDKSIQHGGITLGPLGLTEHDGRNMPPTSSRHTSRRTAAAVTGALLATRREVFDRTGGFDDVHLPVSFNDVDYCLRVRECGWSILFDGHLLGIHNESKTLKSNTSDQGRQRLWEEGRQIMVERWGDAFFRDPSYNLHLSRHFPPFKRIARPDLASIRQQVSLDLSKDKWRVGPRHSDI